MMRRTVIGLAILFCILIAAASSALGLLAAIADRTMLAQERELAAGQFAAQRDYVGAERCFNRAATIYYSRARVQEAVREYQDAAEHYLKAATMHAAASKYRRMHLKYAWLAFAKLGELEKISFMGLTVDYVDMGKYKEQRLMHELAAFCYDEAARQYIIVTDDDHRQTRLMLQGAAEQYEASAMCAMALFNYQGEAEAYSNAFERYTEIGNDDKAQTMADAKERCMSEAEIQCSGTHNPAPDNLARTSAVLELSHKREKDVSCLFGQ